VSPSRGDRVTVPPTDDQWDVRFGTGEAAVGWEELCATRSPTPGAAWRRYALTRALAQATTGNTGCAAISRRTGTTAGNLSNGSTR
jgi:hypothetical protein